MKSFTLAASVILLSLLRPISLPPEVSSQRSEPRAVVNGKRIFNQSCSSCHNTLSTATKSGPGLQSYYRHRSHPDDTTVRAIIQQGKGRMPAFSTLNKSQIDDLVVYLKTL